MLSFLENRPRRILRLSYIGQITEIKGVHVLLEAIQLLPEAPLSCSIYGDLNNKFPKYVEKLRQIAGEDERIQFKGTFVQEQISGVFQNIDAIVVPSCWYENSPNVILEAFAHRTPVIASDLGALPELVVHEKNGLLFEMGDASQPGRSNHPHLGKPKPVEPSVERNRTGEDHRTGDR